MDKKLYEQAKKNILKEKEKEFKEEVREEYKHLVYLSQMIKANAQIIRKVESLKKKVNKMGARSMADGYYLNSLRRAVNDIIEKGKYHPDNLRILEKKVKERLSLK